MSVAYDAFLLLSFGGPEGPDDVIPFLENVLRGKNVPRERMLEVAEHYHHFGGVSPINEQNRRLIAALTQEFEAVGLDLPIYWGNRNWRPLLPDTLAQMARDGVRRAIALATSAFSSYSSCRQYLENIADAQEAVGIDAPRVDKLRPFFNHPGFIEPMAERVREALQQVSPEHRETVPLLFAAHSIPQAMADHCPYETQLSEASRLVAEAVGRDQWRLVYQSRSGPPSQPWLEPDVVEVLTELGGRGDTPEVIVVPIGFVSDHMEVLYDLDWEAKRACEACGVKMVRAGTVGDHPRFVRMIVELIQERRQPTGEDRAALGRLGAAADVCPTGCCPYPLRRPTAAGRPDA